MILNKILNPSPPALSRSLSLRLACIAAAALLAGCALPAGKYSTGTPEVHLAAAASFEPWHRALDSLLPADVLLLGEQHDADEHHALEAETVRELAARRQLAALVLEMAEAGTSTQGLPADASEPDVQAALRWNDKGWPWASYGPAVMQAVRAGVPVLGGNLPRSAMPGAMKDPRFDRRLDAAAMQLQVEAIRKGHCDLLPETQLQPMARVQLARDESMARTIAEALQPGRTVLLIAGNGHVRQRLGVPQWLSENIRARKVMARAGRVDAAIQSEADLFIVTPALTPKDHCASLREQWKR